MTWILNNTNKVIDLTNEYEKVNDDLDLSNEIRDIHERFNVPYDNHPLSMRDMVTSIKSITQQYINNEVINKNQNFQDYMKAYLNANIVFPKDKKGKVYYDDKFCESVMKRIQAHSNMSKRANYKLMKVIKDGLKTINSDNFFLNFIETGMAKLNDEELKEFTKIHALMGKQLECLRRTRSAKIRG